MKEENYEDNKELKKGRKTEKYKHVDMFFNNK